jgi:hypothetical protein
MHCAKECDESMYWRTIKVRDYLPEDEFKS